MRARILPPTPENLALAADAIARGEVVGMPTETVYGLAGAALQADALTRIFETKERPTFDPLIIHVGFAGKGVHELERLRLIDGSAMTDAARARAQALIQAFWPGPLTLVLPRHPDVPDLATSGLPTVALRMPGHRVAQALIAMAGTPLAAPSANRFGRISPTSAEAVAEELGDRIDLILDGGPCEVGVESTVIRVEADGTLTQLRPGGLSRERIEAAAGIAVGMRASSSRPGEGPDAPGMLESHYAPSKPMHLLAGPVATLGPEAWAGIAGLATGANAMGFLLQSGDSAGARELIAARLGAAGLTRLPELEIRTLSARGDLAEAARSLFARMRELDASGARVIFSEPCAADRGLGHAIADRLSRACASWPLSVSH